MTDNPFDPGYVEPEPAFEAAPVSTVQCHAGSGKSAIITAPGFYPEVTPNQYFAEPCPAPALTNSGIKLLAPIGAAPAKFAHYHPAIGQPEEERKATAAQYRGKLVHRLALDKGDDYVISPYDEFRSNEAKAWKADADARGIMPVKQKAFDEAEAMAAIVRERIVDACKGHPYQTEVVIAWQEDVAGFPIWCRAMLDVWCPALGLALDVKTCADASDEAIGRAFANGYATQDAWYRRGLEALTKDYGRVRFGFLFVEGDEPHLSRPAVATESFRHGAKLECERAMAVFARCMKAGEWPGYSDLKVDPPSWLLHRWTAAEMMELAA